MSLLTACRRSFRAFDQCKVVANALNSLNLLEFVVEQLNNGADILRDSFTPETCFNSVHNIVSILTQNCMDDAEDRPAGCIKLNGQSVSAVQHLLLYYCL